LRLFRRNKRKRNSRSSIKETAKRVLIIGSLKHADVKCISWDRDIPNLADYDAIIVNTLSLAAMLRESAEIYDRSGGDQLPDLWKRLYQNAEKARVGLLTLLESQGEVYVVVAPRMEMTLGRVSLFDPNYLTNYSWSPLPLITVEEQGETQVVSDEAFARYMSLVKQWNLFFEPPERQSLARIAERYGGNCFIMPILEFIAHNRYNKPIACRVRYRVYHRVITEKDMLGRPLRTRGEPVMESGPLILLPLPTEVDSHEAINIILEDFFGRPQRTIPPEWTESILMPSIAQLDGEIKERQEESRRIELEIRKKEEQKEEIVHYKQLLFETGPRLVEICEETIEALGGVVLPPDLADEDFIIEFEDKRAIVEVKGNTKSISLSDLAQLGRYCEDYLIHRDEEIKGILLGNAWRLLPLSERNDSTSYPIFPPNVVSYATPRNIALVSTTDLFNAYCAFLNGTIEGAHILRLLFDGVGVTNLR
jgi:hypothetical protein